MKNRYTKEEVILIIKDLNKKLLKGMDYENRIMSNSMSSKFADIMTGAVKERIKNVVDVEIKRIKSW